MERYILRQNIKRFREVLAEETDPRVRATFSELLGDSRRKLALLESSTLGAPLEVERFSVGRKPAYLVKSIRDHLEQSRECLLLIDPRPGLRIVEVSESYASATLTDRARISGERMFDVFPDNPDLVDADGVSNLYQSLVQAARTGRRDIMPIQRYDVRDPNGIFVERRWLPQNVPLFDDCGRLLYLLHHVRSI